MSDYPQCEHTHDTLRRLQALPLNEKVFESRLRIAEWVKYWGEEHVAVSFSGGKDSTVLLDIVRRDYPNVPAVFVNTGLEYPEIVQFVRSTDNVVWLKPKMRFREVLEKYGYPVISKEQSMAISRYRNTDDPQQKHYRLNGFPNGKKGMISACWHFMIDAPFAISEKCCDIMKKEPLKRYAKEYDAKFIIGTMAAEGDLRKMNYVRNGCNAYELKSPLSQPLSFWMEHDIWAYIRLKNLPYSSIYDMGYERTGCAFCMFGCPQEQDLNGENRFQKMERTHPKLWRYCMEKLGIKEVLEYMGLPYRYEYDLFKDFGSEEKHDED